jgi:mono/diheme cytochrome c family protein
MKLLFGVVILTVVLGLIVGWLLMSHFNVAANAPPDLFDSLAIRVRNASIQRQAKDAGEAPAHAGLAAHGADHYREHCLPCHAAPGAKRADFAEGMNPMPPALDEGRVQQRSDAELSWIVKNGIRMSAMPAFGGDHSDAEIQDIVAFVRDLPHLSASEKQALSSSVESHAEH